MLTIAAFNVFFPDHCELLCCSQVFPHGLPEEFTLIFTLALKKAALRDTAYLFQISDQQGYPQVHLILCCHTVWHLFHSTSHIVFPPSLYSLPWSLTFYLSHFLSIPSRCCLSPLFCIVIHIPLDFFSLVTPFQCSPPFHPTRLLSSLILHPVSRSLSRRRSSLNHLLLSSFIHLHCYSCVFHDEALESHRVPIITSSL